jgi:hypothetical protein
VSRERAAFTRPEALNSVSCPAPPGAIRVSSLVFELDEPEAVQRAAKPDFEALVRSVRLFNEQGWAAGPLRPGAGFIQ